MSITNLTPAGRSIRNYTIVAAVTVFVLLGSMAAWAATARLSGAVVGAGTVMVDGHVKKIQHREGGIVGDIRVSNGAAVKAGDLLIRLDDTITRANLAVVVNQVDQFMARRARLIAERDDLAEFSVPADTEGAGTAEYASAERALFVARKRTLDGQKAQLRQRIDQIGRETDGLKIRLEAKKAELKWIEEELSGVRSLTSQKLIQFNRLAELERMRAAQDGERGQLLAEIARAATRVTETELQILQLEQDRRTEAATELRDVDNKLAELAEKRVAAEDELRRIDILAPQAGVVHELAVHTIGGVIAPGDTLMQIVPINDALVVETRIQPADIDQVHVGQKATLRFSAFNQRTTPEIFGEVKTVAADLISNPQTGEAWYTARIRIPTEELARLNGMALMAGMPVETFIQTGERTALSYLVKPLTDQVARAMREE